MAMLKTALAILARGFLLGLGFTVAALAVVFVTEEASKMRRAHRESITKVEAKAAQLVISDVEKRVSGDQIFFTGKIINNGKTVEYGEMEVNLFKQGKFVDQYATHVSSLKPGESRYFKIICGHEGAPPAEHDSYKVQLRDD
ncbi:MAG: FxLYD domain-containing protein [Burkholderiaceae bacterium]|jgi:hypothetical protein|nr:FxLYD domain-containing protein [Burkholderiaceae bacterium]